MASSSWQRVLRAARVAWNCDSDDDRAYDLAVQQLEREVLSWASANGWQPPEPRLRSDTDCDKVD